MNREVEILATSLYKIIQNIQVNLDVPLLDIYKIQDTVEKGYADEKPELAMRFLSDTLHRHNNVVSRMADQIMMSINIIKTIETLLEIYAHDSVKKSKKEKKGE